MYFKSKLNLSRKELDLLIVVCTTGFVLTALSFGNANGLATNALFKYLSILDLSRELTYLIGWVLFSAAVYFVVPAVAVISMKQRLVDYGLRLTRKGAFLYWVFPVLILPGTFFVAMDSQFQMTYPFLHQPGSMFELVIWEAAYILQFLALEFFFRGFMFTGLAKTIGAYASILLCSIPYLMIHFSKPLPEAISSFFGSMILSYLVLRYKTIIYGFYAHIVFAVSLDIFSLYHRGWFDNVSL